MRLIGQLKNEQQARCLAHYLYSQGIESQVDPASDGQWEVWILDDDQVEAGQGHLERFQHNPTAPEFTEGAKAGLHLQRRQEKVDTPKRARVIDGRMAIQRPVIAMGLVTVTFMAISIAVTLITWFSLNHPLAQQFIISHFSSRGPMALAEIRRGQIWRLFTPIFLHLGPLHILFNMWWLKDLGAIIESFKGSWFLLILSLVIAAISNLAQYFIGGPYFGGMSGVIFGLLGYLWTYGKFNPTAPIRLNPQIVQFMVIYFFICLTGLMGPIANTAHGVGAGVGMAWGYIAAQWAKIR